jgi:hypothetical protein
VEIDFYGDKDCVYPRCGKVIWAQNTSSSITYKFQQTITFLKKKIKNAGLKPLAFIKMGLADYISCSRFTKR